MRRILKISLASVAAIAMAGYVSAAKVEAAKDSSSEKIKTTTVADPKISEGNISLDVSGMV